MKITKVYTRTGDAGTTSLVGGIRASKASARIEAYGTVDELNSHLGLLAAMIGDGTDRNFVERVQTMLFNVGSYLATDITQTALPSSACVGEGETELLEKEIDDIISLLPEKMGFVLPGGSMAAAEAHVCRTVCRRAERAIVALQAEATVAPQILGYVNRLSDYLFVLAKKINFVFGVKEKTLNNYCG